MSLVSPCHRTTITDVARATRVSIQTVSAVFHDKPGISEKTRQRVRRAIDRLHYVPNALASSLRARRSRTIGVLIPSITNPYFPDFVRGIEDGARRAGYSIFLCNSDEQREKEIEYLQVLRQHTVSGFIVAYDLSNRDVERTLLRLLAHHTPVVTLCSRQIHEGAMVLKTDDRAGALTVTRHLIELGHQRIALIQPPAGSSVCVERTEGFLSGLKERGLILPPEYLVPGGFTIEAGHRGATYLAALALAPTAIVSANDLVAIGAICALKDLKIQVPGMMSVTGFDDIRMASLVDPALTTIAQPTYRMGQAALEAILEKLANPKGRGRVLNFETSLVRRDSTAAPPMERSPLRKKKQS
jgi:LacI family transcriptional regulator